MHGYHVDSNKKGTRQKLYTPAAILTTDASSVSVSTSTISPVCAKDGTVISRTACPSVPWIVLVEKRGWEPTK